MPYHIYLKINNYFQEQLVEFYNTLANNVKNGIYKEDIESLQYPPHVTISYDFEENDPEVLKAIQKDIEMMFSVPFSTEPRCFKVVTANSKERYHRITFEWSELGYRVKFLKNKYKLINWKTYDFHITLVDGTSSDVMKMTKKILPKITKPITFDIVMYEYLLDENSKYYSTLKKWNELYSLKLN